MREKEHDEMSYGANEQVFLFTFFVLFLSFFSFSSSFSSILFFPPTRYYGVGFLISSYFSIKNWSELQACQGCGLGSPIGLDVWDSSG